MTHERPEPYLADETLYSAPVHLKHYLLEAAKTAKLATERLPGIIDLGEFGVEAERSVKLSLLDPQHPEFASIACLDHAGRVLLLKHPIRGDEHSVALPIFPDKRRVLLIHTHGSADTPLSPGDLVALLVSPGTPLGVPAGLLATPSLKLLAMRTQATPDLSPLELLDAAVMMDLHPAMQERQNFIGSTTSWMTGKRWTGRHL
jgi:hypothetical protein